MPLASGTRLGPYEIEAPLGAGGMGEVYRARDTRLDRAVALKVLAAQHAGDPAFAARFAREARAVAALSHPNVVGIFDVGEATAGDGQRTLAYAVTELLDGATLRERTAAGPLPVRTATGFALQIARGLAAAHDKGIVHRDLKPENLFVTTDGRIKILDFGLARQVPEAPAAAETRVADGVHATHPGIVMGTVGYMAPEQARGQPVDQRGDIFALGAILYEMLSGRRAFAGDTTADTMAAIVRDDPPDIEQVNPGVPAAVGRIVRRCLDKQPDGRFRSAHDLALALEAVSDSTPRTSADAARGAADARKSIVVLPFQNISPDAENEFFADGLTEEIISDLSKIHRLRVISRTSAMQLKGRTANLPSLVRELNVQYVLEGSVRRAGDRLRINAQLIDPSADAHLWSEKYHGTMEDVFDIQERVARAIAAELRVKLTPDESREIAQRPIADPAAYDCYLRARADLMKFTEDGLRRAVTEIDHGLELAGENVLLLSVKGEAAWQSFNLGLTPDVAELEEVRAIARRIEALEPGSPHAERLWGLVAGHSGRLAEGARRLRRALDANPNDAMALGIFSLSAALLGRSGEARPFARRLLDIDPLEPLAAAIAAYVEFLDGQFEKALQLTARAHAAAPLNPGMAMMHAQAIAANGRVAEAIAICEGAERQRPDDSWTWFSRALKWGLTGDGDALAASMTAERRAWLSADPQYALIAADCFALAGRAEEAFEWLETMLRTGALPYPYLARLDPFLAKIRPDPRWPALIERMRTEFERIEL